MRSPPHGNDQSAGKVYANQICSGQVPPAEPLDEAIAAAAVSTGLVCTGGDGDSGFARATLTAKSFKDKLSALGEGFALADACTECFESDACKSCAKVQVQVTLEGLLAMSQSEVRTGKHPRAAVLLCGAAAAAPCLACGPAARLSHQPLYARESGV